MTLIRILAAAMVGIIALLGMPAASAQDAPSESGPNLFADLGLSELTITVSESSLEVDQSEVPAGRYLVTLVDEAADPERSTGFVRLDEGETLEDLSYADEVAAGTPVPTEEPPIETYVFLFDNYIAGGPSAASTQVVVDLPAGNYGVWVDNPFSEIPAIPLTVTGDSAAAIEGPEPEAAVTIIEEGEGGVGFSFRVDGELSAGPQIVKVLNASDQPHFIYTWQYPEPVTLERVMNTMMFDPSSGATPSPDLLDFEQFSFAGYVSAHSAGTTQWVTMNLAEGQAILICFVGDPETDGVPHAFEGMIEVVDVGP
jgi:hypothetical protein